MNQETWSFVRDKLASDCPVHMQIVTSFTGSSPGKTGAKMFISHDGDVRGTIGGGIMEHNLQQEGLKHLATQNPTPKSHTLVHSAQSTPDTQTSGLMCAGSQTVVFINLLPQYLDEIQTLCCAFSESKPAWLILDSQRVHFSLLKPEPASSKGLYIECLNRNNEIFIFGDGHVGRAMANNLDLLAYTYHIFPTPKSEEELKHIPAIIGGCQNAFAVVVSSSADTDLMCLRMLLDSDLAYCGIMGSAAKKARILKNLLQNVEKPSWFKSIHSPIGLPINSESPAEIAVSISAELVSVLKKFPAIL